MGKKLEYTPNTIIKHGLRWIFLRSRERLRALRRDKYTCQICGKKQSKAKDKEVKVEAHHLDGIDWETLIAEIRRTLLCHEDRLITHCKECHKKVEGKNVE